MSLQKDLIIPARLLAVTSDNAKVLAQTVEDLCDGIEALETQFEATSALSFDQANELKELRAKVKKYEEDKTADELAMLVRRLLQEPINDSLKMQVTDYLSKKQLRKLTDEDQALKDLIINHELKAITFLLKLIERVVKELPKKFGDAGEGIVIKFMRDEIYYHIHFEAGMDIQAAMGRAEYMDKKDDWLSWEWWTNKQ
jgi:hypothetical protein